MDLDAVEAKMRLIEARAATIPADIVAEVCRVALNAARAASMRPPTEVGFGPMEEPLLDMAARIRAECGVQPAVGAHTPATHSPEAGETIARAIQPSPYCYGLTSRWHR